MRQSHSTNTKPKGFRSLRIRLLKPLLLLSAVAALVGSFGIYLITSQQLKQELQLRGTMLSEAIIIAAENSTSLGDLQRSVLAMAGEPNIESIELVSQDFKPIFANEILKPQTHVIKYADMAALVQKALVENTSVGSIDMDNHRIYRVITPVLITALPQTNVLKPEPALLIVDLHTGEAKQKAIHATLLLTALFSSLGFFALLLIYFLMNHWVLKPSLRIVSVMEQQQLRGSASTGFEPIHELGLIGQTFDQLSQTLATREQALELAVHSAQEANIAKSQFLANMSHELRTPMNAILGMLALLRKTELNSRQADYAVKSEGAARSLLSLLNDILDISKAEAGKMELDPIPFNLDNLARDLGVILSTNLTQKSVELHLDIAPELPRYFVGDAMRLQQILINLGGNAIKFTERGSVTIHITPEIKTANILRVKFSVEDSGIGIAPENQAKIFSGFTQAEASTTRRFGGTGLGLAISQRLVALMGGKLQLESALGSGSCFFFSIDLPLLDDEGIKLFTRAQQQQAQQLGQLRLQNMHILLVEDNLNNQQIALELLEAEGAYVQIANHGEEALQIIKANTSRAGKVFFDVVLMDLQMPVMDGLNATRAIRIDLGLKALPIIAMTANAMDSDRELCLSAGMNDHVGKPFDLHQLVTLLRLQAGWSDIPIAPDTSFPKAPTTQTPTPEHSPAQDANNYSIDLKGALQRLGGNQSLYSKMLPKFLSTLEQLTEKLRQQLAQKNMAGFQRELHSLKGLAATMGATQLSTDAAIAEKRIRSDASPEIAEIIISEISSAIQISLPLLQNLAVTLSIS